MPIDEGTTWICLDCARHGGRQLRCPDCDKSHRQTVKERAEAAVRALINAFRAEKHDDLVTWRDEAVKMGISA